MHKGEYYHSFIVYPNASDAKQIAEILHKTIKKFKKPHNLKLNIDINEFKKVYKKEVPLTKRVEEGSQNQIDDILHSSKYLIIICTIDTPNLPFITHAINEFKNKGKEKNIFTILVNGSFETSLPTELKSLDNKYLGRKGVNVCSTRVPLAVNICSQNPKISLLLFKNTEKYRILSSILECEYDDLKERSKKYAQKSFLRKFVVASIAILLVSAYYSYKLLGIYSYASRTETYKYQTESIIVKLYSDIPEKIEKYPRSSEFMDAVMWNRNDVYNIINTYRETFSQDMNASEERKIQITDQGERQLANMLKKLKDPEQLGEGVKNTVDDIFKFDLAEGIDDIGIHITTYRESSWFLKTHFGGSIPRVTGSMTELESEASSSIKSLIPKADNLIGKSKGIIKKTKWTYIKGFFAKCYKFLKYIK